MKQLTKTQRQLLEYNRLVGFNLIKEKYHKLITLLETKKFESINSEFTNYANKIKTQFGIKHSHLNYYQRVWNQTYNSYSKKY